MISAWAVRHTVSPKAVEELLAILRAGAPVESEKQLTGHSEAAVQQLIRLEVAHRGGRAWRNNSGAAQDTSGRVVRYGLGNDSAAACKIFKSSDLIGITPIVCECGKKYGIFTAYEVKAPGWKLRPGDKRAQAQFNFIKLVAGLGGYARFATSPEDVV